MKPTILGQRTAASVPTDLAAEPLEQSLTIVPGNTGAITLSRAQAEVAQAELQKLNFATIPGREIVTIGQNAELALAKILDGFLNKLDKKRAAKTFELFGRLEKGVDDANLPEVVALVKAGPQPGAISAFFKRRFGKTQGEIMREAWEKIQEVITGKTKNLSDVMVSMEKELQTEMQQLLQELKALDLLKDQYAERIDDFAIAAAVSRAFCDAAVRYVASEEARVAQLTDPMEKSRLQDLQAKLELLKSRTLALEGTYTRLPGDRLVIQQIEQAGVATFMETLTTASQRFSSIKNTLIAIHGVFQVQTVQEIGARSRKMDDQMSAIRGGLLKEAVTVAANAPGDNRLAQAAQIEKMITDIREVNEIVKNARVENERKFDEARNSFAMSRQAISDLSKN